MSQTLTKWCSLSIFWMECGLALGCRVVHLSYAVASAQYPPLYFHSSVTFLCRVQVCHAAFDTEHTRGDRAFPQILWGSCSVSVWDSRLTPVMWQSAECCAVSWLIVTWTSRYVDQSVSCWLDAFGRDGEQARRQRGDIGENGVPRVLQGIHRQIQGEETQETEETEEFKDLGCQGHDDSHDSHVRFRRSCTHQVALIGSRTTKCPSSGSTHSARCRVVVFGEANTRREI